jgi:hypothetical protein
LLNPYEVSELTSAVGSELGSLGVLMGSEVAEEVRRREE